MTTKLERRILNFIQDNSLLVKGDKILLALSGGPDSVFAFNFLVKFSIKIGVTFYAMHINHNLRGEASDSDELFCKQLCAENNIDLFVHSVNIAPGKRSLEEAAREIRYSVLNREADQNNFTKILTAHNSDDNTETIFLNLIKGCGVKALSGIPIKRGKVIRPFLCVTKYEILEFLNENGIAYRIDSSNYDSKFERNYLRNEILPKIRQNINPNLNQSVFNTSGIVRNFYSLHEKSVSDLYKKYIKKVSGSIIVKNTLFEENNFLRGEVLKKVFKEELGIEFNRKNFGILISLNNNQVGKGNPLSGGWFVTKERNFLELRKIVETSDAEMEFIIGESCSNKEITIATAILERKDIMLGSGKNLEFISADNLDDIFILRRWKTGDRFKPLGLKGKKKVSDFLTDSKISNKSRKNVYVLLNRNKIVWVVGLRIDDNYKITENTKKICLLHLK